MQRAFDLTAKNVVVADIGGGSTEIILASGNLIEATFTTPLGAVRLTEMYGTGNGVDDAGFDKLSKAIDQQFRRLTRKPFFAPHLPDRLGGHLHEPRRDRHGLQGAGRIADARL